MARQRKTQEGERIISADVLFSIKPEQPLYWASRVIPAGFVWNMPFATVMRGMAHGLIRHATRVEKSHAD